MQGEASNADIERARRRGDVVVSRRLIAAATLAASCILLPWCVAQAWTWSKGALVDAIASSNVDGGAQTAMPQITKPLFAILLPVVAALALVALLTAYAQGGGRFAKRRAPRQGFEAPLSAFVGLASFVLVAALGVVLVYGARRVVDEGPALPAIAGAENAQLGSVRHAAAQSLEATLRTAGAEALRLLLVVAALAVLVGLVDWLLMRFAWRRRLFAQRKTERRNDDEVAPELRRARQRAHRAVVGKA